MIITVNGDAIDYTLENEKTAGDILAGVTSWLDETGLLVGGITVNGEPVQMSGGDWTSLDLSSVEEIAIEAVSVREGRIRQLETCRDFFILMSSAAAAEDQESLKEVEGGYPDLLRILPHLLDERNTPLLTGALEASLKEAGFPMEDPPAPILGKVSAEADRMAAILEIRRREIASPASEAVSSAKALAALAPTLDDVAVNLQTGRDKQAMETIIVLTELLQTLMRTLSWTEGPQEMLEELTEILAELEDALKASDTVLIGDLLEYEIKPRLLDLPGKLENLEEAVS